MLLLVARVREEADDEERTEADCSLRCLSRKRLVRDRVCAKSSRRHLAMVESTNLSLFFDSWMILKIEVAA